MAKRKKPNKFVSTSGYKPSAKTINKLQRYIKNYNARIRNAKRKLGEFKDILPDVTSVTEVIEKATSISDINKRIKELERFKGKGLEITALPSGDAISQAELTNIEERIKSENRYRKSRERMKAGIEEEQGRFRTQRDEENKPVEIKDTDTLERLRNKQERYTNYYRNLQASRWRDTYIGKLDDAMIVALQNQMGEDVIDKIQNLKGMIASIPSTTLVTLASYAPDLDITITSDVVAMLNAIDEVVDNWENFIEEYIDY